MTAADGGGVAAGRDTGGEQLLIVGNPALTHVGGHLNRAARPLGLTVQMCDSSEAFRGSYWINKANWWLRGHRPTRLRAFGEEIVRVCREVQPRWMLSTGLAPVDAWVLEAIGALRIQRLNYLTDNPWNEALAAPWFTRTLPLYDCIFTPRQVNVDQLRRIGCPRVSYLPFGYAPDVHFPERPTAEQQVHFASDVVFFGGADRDRVPYVTALIRAGFQVGLYGGYWERYRQTRRLTRGQADPPTLRCAVGGAKVVLCLVRRGNQDGHSMRTFEVPAMGGCMLTEDTAEHRALFGEDGECVRYFRTPAEAVEKARWLLVNEAERHRLAMLCHERITRGRNTYRDRLASMLALCPPSPVEARPDGVPAATRRTRTKGTCRCGADDDARPVDRRARS